MKLLRKILFPFVPIYFLVTWLRNKCYDVGLKSSKSYKTPVICVGNLSTGGTGKTPTIEYLVRLLQEQYRVATLSRGYKRESRGFIIASHDANAKLIGDEPFQFYQKFEGLIVSVDANRQRGIEKLIELKQPDVILLDDAFQHRKVTAAFSILLTAYDNLYSEDLVLPTGNLREPSSGASRADCIIVTKCPSELSSHQQDRILEKLKPLPHQMVCFSSIIYSKTISNTHTTKAIQTLRGKHITLVTGIADPKPMLNYLLSESLDFEHLEFNDHHSFTSAEIEMLQQKECILTTEKDYVRLKDSFKSKPMKLWYLPIAFKINESELFDARLLSFMNSFQH